MVIFSPSATRILTVAVGTRRCSSYVHVEQLELIRPSRHAQNFFSNDGFDILVVNVLLLVGQLFEAHEGAVHVFLAQVKAQMLQPLIEAWRPECLPMTSLPEYRWIGVISRSQLVLEHTILMNAASWAKALSPTIGLLIGSGSRSLATANASWRVVPANVGGRVEIVLARAQRHDHFLERSITGALAMPLIVHSICRAPLCTAARELPPPGPNRCGSGRSRSPIAAGGTLDQMAISAPEF